MPATQISPATAFAQFTDPADNLIALYRNTSERQRRPGG